MRIKKWLQLFRKFAIFAHLKKNEGNVHRTLSDANNDIVNENIQQ